MAGGFVVIENRTGVKLPQDYLEVYENSWKRSAQALLDLLRHAGTLEIRRMVKAPGFARRPSMTPIGPIQLPKPVNF